MFSILLLLCVMTSLSSAAPSHSLLFDINEALKYFEEFMTIYNKEYKNENERQSRFDIFKNNLELINQQNLEREETATFGINQFSDMTLEEFKTAFLTELPETNTPCAVSKNFSSSYQLSAPKSWDWRKKNVVTKVKNQKSCLSCWAFSAIGNLEGQYAIKHGKLQDFSEQQLLDCTPTNAGCNGGYMSNAIQKAMQDGGVMGEQSYPYKAVQGHCQFKGDVVRAKITNCYDIKIRSEEELKGILVENGPIAFAIDATDIKLYQGGVLGSCRPGKLNHAVLLVGYGKQGGIPYWIIKNSWSEQWGERGYIRLQMGVNACNMMNSPFTTGEVA